ncbi:MAG TPA: ribosome silencing factor [Burkholderiaceae bacterium]|nr:ribosome silencing factor [Burkholderiaceae bacterium]
MNIQQLQRVIVDALEDVKAQDIRVFSTQHMTAMFDRVVMASGTSNRQTKALAASVRDKVKQAGGHIVSIEGEDVGEWVLVDCGDAIVHIMQPAIRQYYHLEDIWGEKPVQVKSASDEAGRRRRVSQAETALNGAAPKKTAKKTAAKKTTTPARKTAKTTTTATAKKAPARKRATETVAAKKTAPRKTSVARKTTSSASATRPARKSTRSS